MIPPAGTPRQYLGLSWGVPTSPSAYPVVETAGRYVIEYRTSELGAAMSTSIDGVDLPLVDGTENMTVYTQSFHLTVGQHTIGLGGPEMYSAVSVYLTGPF